MRRIGSDISVTCVYIWRCCKWVQRKMRGWLTPQLQRWYMERYTTMSLNPMNDLHGGKYAFCHCRCVCTNCECIFFLPPVLVRAIMSSSFLSSLIKLRRLSHVVLFYGIYCVFFFILNISRLTTLVFHSPFLILYYIVFFFFSIFINSFVYVDFAAFYSKITKNNAHMDTNWCE